MAQFHFTPEDYLELMHDEVPAFDEFEDEVARAATVEAERMLELGTGSGETSRRVMAANPDSILVGVDLSEAMLDEARRVLPTGRIEALHVAGIEDPLPEGPFDLVFSALAVHHLEGIAKVDLFKRVSSVLAPEGRFVLGDVVVPLDPADAITPCTPDFDFPSPARDQLEWLVQAGLDAGIVWEHKDLVVIRAGLG